MGSRQPLTWLVIDYQPDRPTLLSAPLAIFGRASYDCEGDTLTVTTILGTNTVKDVTHVGSYPMQALAKQLLRELIRDASTRP